MQTTAPISNVALTPQSPASALADAWAASLPHTICEGRFRIEAAAFDVLRPQLIRAYRTHLQGISREDASEFNERLAHYERTCFGAVLRDEAEPFEIVGSLLLEAIEPGTLYIRWMNLLPRAQANGIPEALLRHLLRFARSSAFRRVEADIQFQNSNFLKVLSGRGFTVAGIQLSERWGSTVRLSRSIAPSSGSIPSRKEEQHHEEESQEVCSGLSVINIDQEVSNLPDRLRARIESYCREWFKDLELFRRIDSGSVSLREMTLYLEGARRLLATTPIHLQLARLAAKRRKLESLDAFLSEKIAEETGHDAWAKSDLEGLLSNAGASLDDLASLSFPQLDQLIAGIFNLAVTDLESYLGYLLLAELSMVYAGPRALRGIQLSLGLQPQEISVVQRHAELDQNHAVDDLAAIGSFLDPLSFHKVETALKEVNETYRAWIREISLHAET